MQPAPAGAQVRPAIGAIIPVMASVTVPIQGTTDSHLRPLNILRDLPQVADLIELCFASTMDDDGQSYLQQMRRASHDSSFLHWASTAAESASLPLSGFIWEVDGKIVGNVSLVPYYYRSRKIALIANVATHPDYRRHGIGRALTERAMQQAYLKGAKEIWLHVRDDNPTAIRIYANLGFVERARRTTYHARPDPLLPPAEKDVSVTPRHPRFWPQQREWLNQLHPDELTWYSRWNWNALGTGFKCWLYRAFVEFDFRQWAAVKNGRLLATLTWMSSSRPANVLWAANDPAGDGSGLKAVLEAARRELIHQRRLAVEYPAGLAVEAILAAGFQPQRTLLWMRSKAAASPTA